MRARGSCAQRGGDTSRAEPLGDGEQLVVQVPAAINQRPPIGNPAVSSTVTPLVAATAGHQEPGIAVRHCAPRRPGRSPGRCGVRAGWWRPCRLASDGQRPVAPLDAQGLDVGAGGLGDAQPVEGKQGDERVLGRLSKASGDQQRAEFIAVQPVACDS
jgi:hypothetical protein